MIALGGLCVSMARGQVTVASLCLSILVWIVWSWVAFLWYSSRELESLRVQRTVNGRQQPSGILWAGRKVEVHLVLECEESYFRMTHRIRDVIPENFQMVQAPRDAFPGSNTWLSSLSRTLVHLFLMEDKNENPNEMLIRRQLKKIQICYIGQALGAGEVVMPGVRIQFQDSFKFFRRETFFEAKQTFQVLPSFVVAQDTSPILKKLSVIPRQGIHRHQRAGIGFELLELREYVDGDPPKSIAWKASARREKLMSRQYESEVPVRVQLILDGTGSTRVGGYGLRLIDQIANTAATIARTVIQSGDAVGAYYVRDDQTHYEPATMGEKGFYRQMQAMAQFAKNTSPKEVELTAALLETAYAACHERFPELLDPQMNPVSMTAFAFLMTRANRQRTQLSAVMAELYDLSPATQVKLTWNNPLLASCLARFLTECGSPWMAPIVSPSDMSKLRSGKRSSLIAKAVHSATGRARDNEVLVVIAELLGTQLNRGELLESLKMAKAKYHRVAVIIPSPTFLRPKPKTFGHILPNVSDLRQEAEHLHLSELALPLKRSLAKLGIPFAVSGEAKAMRLVLSEMQMARDGRARSTGSKR